MPKSFCVSVSLLVLILLTGVARAQSGGSVAGTVVDPLGATIAGASVTLVHDGVVAKQAVSGPAGEFSFDGLAEGRYQLEAGAPGFQTRTIDAVFIGPSDRQAIDIALPIGPLEQSVSVTAAATDVLPSQIGAPVTVLNASTLAAVGKIDVFEALRLMPGVSLVQTGARGGVTSIFVRGGNSNFNKVLIDGIPVNDIGGGVDLAPFSIAGVERVEALRDPNSVVFGSDALSGVVSLTSRRGLTRIPELTLSVDGGNLATDHESFSIGGAARRFDYFSVFEHLGTDNDVPNNAYRSKTYAGRFGVALGRSTDVSGTVRWIDRRYESPNAFALFGVADDSFQAFNVKLLGVSSHSQITNKWQTTVRVGSFDQRLHVENPTLSGTVIGGIGFGNVMPISGANGYTVTGRAILDFGPFKSDSRSARQGFYGQTSYQVVNDFNIAAGVNVEREQGFPATNIEGDPTTTRNNRAAWMEGRGTIAHRVSLTAGVGYAHNDVFGNAFSPRLSVAAYLRTPEAARFWGDTRLTFNAGKGIKAPTVFQETNSLYTVLQRTAAGSALAQANGIGPVGPERGRNVDVGMEQGMWGSRARVRVAYFDNAFYDLVESVSRNLLPQLGIPAAVAAQVTSANVNSQSFTAKGIETSADAEIGRVRLAGSYTHLNATITQSLSSTALTPSFNPAFPGIPIGSFGPLLGQQPFRRPANSGSLFVSYREGPLALGLSGYFAGKSNDSTFLSDASFGNSLLLPNEDLDDGYAKLDVSASYAVTRALKAYLTLENLGMAHYQPAFGYPALPITARAGITVSFGAR